tara:strand:+ start:227349 stop:228446 length:1098 start_codon:yes stop_codon:yes gene_type:complete
MINTLNIYLAKNYLRNCIGLLLVFLSIIYLFDSVELIRRASKFEDVGMPLILHMALLKLPEIGQTVMPFVILYGAIYTFWMLSKRSELVIIRAAGLSAWQFLTPLIAVAMLLGILQITAINPLSAALLARFEQLESTHLSHQKNLIALFEGGLWLKQKNEDDKGGYIIIHAEKVHRATWQLDNVIVLYFDADDRFTRRIDAPNAVLSQGKWAFKNATLNAGNSPALPADEYSLPTDLTREDIEETFSSPETISFWKLPSFIKTLETAGFDNTRMKIHLHNLLSLPVLFAAMIFLAAVVSLRPQRSGNTTVLLLSGIFLGFVIFLGSSFLKALGISQQIPIILSAWSPATLTLLLGGAALFTLEDG